MRRPTLLLAASLVLASTVTATPAGAQVAPTEPPTAPTTTPAPTTTSTTVGTTSTTALSPTTTTTSPTASAPTSTTLVPATPPAAVEATSTAPKVRGVGDSVFRSAESKLIARLRPEYRPRFRSVLGASIQDMTPTARQMAGNGPASMVIGLGNPDVETMAGAYGFVVYQWADRLLRDLRDVPCVVWVNLKQRGVNRYYTPRWEQASRTFNQWLVGAATPGGLYYPNLHVLDWNRATIGHPAWFLADGLHLNETGQANYARKVDRFLNRVCPP
ncbi:MAG: hypothetical protein KDB35_20750 [Acidimicrobiales bacterium]|nr:hypothetical protein [Acidimicrobiales bacterium]